MLGSWRSNDKPISNLSSHGVAGEVGGSSSSNIKESPRAGWFDGVLKRPGLTEDDKTSTAPPPNRLSPRNNSAPNENNNNSISAIEEELLRKVKLQDEQLEKLRQEAAFQKRLNTGLKKQLSEYQNGDASASSAMDRMEELNREVTKEQGEKFRLLRQIAELDLHVKDLTELLENERSLTDQTGDVDDRVASLTRELTETKQALQQAQRAVVRLQKEQDAISSIYDQKFGEVQARMQQEKSQLEAQIETLKQQQQKHAASASGYGELQRQLYQKDEVIKQLQLQIEGLKSELQIANENSESVKEEWKAQEQYRKEEANDLRLVNDANETKITKLEQQLEETKQQVVDKENDLANLKRSLDEYDSKTNELTDLLDDKKIIEEGGNTIEKLTALRDRIGRLLQDNQNREKEVEAKQRSLQKVDKQRADQNKQALMKVKAELLAARNNIKKLQAQVDAFKTPEKLIEEKDLLEKKVNKMSAKIKSLEKEDKTMQLKESQEMLQKLKTDFAAERQSWEQQIKDLDVLVAALTKERDVLAEKDRSTSFDSRPEVTSTDRVLHLQEALEELEKKYYTLERNLLDAKLKQAAAEEEKDQLRESYERRLAANVLDEEKKSDSSYDQIHRFNNPAVDAAADSRRLDSLLEEIEKLHNNLKEQEAIQKSRRDVEEKLKKDIDNARSAEKKASHQLQKLTEEKENQKTDLEGKLEDREKTIETLVKSTVALEKQIATSKVEIEALRMRLAKEVGEEGVELIMGESMAPEELKAFRESLISNKDTEARLTKEIKSLRKKLDEAKKENVLLLSQLENSKRDFSENDDDAGSVASATPQRQLKERDDAISKLVKQTMSQQKIISGLQKECKSAAKRIETLTKEKEELPKWEEVRQLRQEAEVFAGQVIEQDEEIEELRNTVVEQERQISALERELFEAKNDPMGDVSMLRDLKAEIDELREANQEQLDELRELRKKAREAEQVSDEASKAKSKAFDAQKDLDKFKQMAEDLGREKIKLCDDLHEARKKISELERKFQNELGEAQARNSATIQKLKIELQQAEKANEELQKKPCSMDEFEIESMKIEIEKLQKNLEDQTQETENAKASIRELEGMIAEKIAEENAANEDEKEELLAEIDTLNKQLQEANEQLSNLEDERELITDFKEKLERADDERQESEKSIIDNYERKISLLALDKDVTIDKLRNELFELKESNAEDMEEMTDRVNECQSELSTVREELTAQVNERETRIYALEHTLSAQEQLLNSMKTEMDHLQGSMESSAAHRRQEIDEMQQELLSLSSTNTKLEREINSLKLELDSREMSHKDEVSKLKEVIGKYEKERSSEHRTAADLQMELRVKEVKDRLEKLKWRNTSLKEENENLRERLEVAEEQAKENKRQIAQTEELRTLVSNQVEQINQLESQIESLKTASKTEEKPAAPLPPVPTTSTIEVKEEPSVQSVSRATSKSKADKKNASATPRRLGFLGRR